ncbi:MAG: serine/threonine protein kinase [Chloroflexi bacterium]|nr:serine/threonine protein kinase [Chloroflexota bacterium]
MFRDLKPDNIMLNKQGQPKLIDFGIARFFKRAQSKDTQAIGTPGYAPPEQHGKQQTDARSDIYSLGVTLWRLLTLQDPSVTPYQLPSVRRYNTAVSTDLEAIIQHAMNLRPEDRFQTMPALRQALQGTQTVTPTPPQPRQVSSVWPAIFLLLLIFVGGGVGMLIYNNQKPPPSARMATATPSSQIVVVNVVTTETGRSHINRHRSKRHRRSTSRSNRRPYSNIPAAYNNVTTNQHAPCRNPQLPLLHRQARN